MDRIKVKHFGPIREGYQQNNGWLDIKKNTVFIGNQGSGKSTLAKLISTISWIEKAIVRGDLNPDYFQDEGRFEKHCEYQNIQSYFKSGSEIGYEGSKISFFYKNGNAQITKKETEQYHLPKIMYVPAERNFISTVRNLQKLRGLPGTLYTFSDEYIKAVQSIRGSIELPINNARLEYQNLNELATIIGNDFKVWLSHASSGFQSLVPLFIVSQFLAESVAQQNDYRHHTPNNELSIQQEKKLREEIQSILSNNNLSDKVKQIQIELLSAKFQYSAFINIVEEPEQNLYPTSQHQILNSLVSLNNFLPANKLVITTHSPYLINYLTLSVKAGMLYKLTLTEEIQTELNSIVPFNAVIAAGDLAIYELDERNGTISLLETYKDIPSDENKLNTELGEFNDMYAHLINIQNRI